MSDLYNTMVSTCRSLGVIPPDSMPPLGKWSRFDLYGDPHGKDDGRVKLFLDGEGGIVCNWKTGEQQTFFVSGIEKLSPEQIAERQKAREASRLDAEAEPQQEREKTAAEAERIWSTCVTATADHPYLLKKGVPADGLRLYNGDLSIGEMACDGALVVPLRDANRKLWSLSFIDTDGEKRFLPGRKQSGIYAAFGPKHSGGIYLAEGVATAKSISMAMNAPCVAAMDAGSLPAVAKAIREKFPEVDLVICADNDANRKGLEKASEAARMVNAQVTMPDSVGWDFNDLHQQNGIESIRQFIKQSSEPKHSITVWHDPLPLPKLPAVPEFPLEILPDAMQAWASDSADRAKYRPDFFAVAAMTALGSVIGRKIGIRMKSQDDWTEYANVWGCIVGDPSAMKSPAQREALSPFKLLQVNADQMHQEAMQQYEAAQESHKIRHQAKKKAATDALAKDAKAEVDLSCGDEPEKPVRHTYWTSDANDASLSEILVTNQNGVLIERDELSALLSNLEDERQATMRGLLLSGWSGGEGYRSDRIMRGITSIPKYALSVFGGIQPGPLMRYIRSAFTGERADGLLQRLQLIVWPDQLPFEYVDRWPDKNAKEGARTLFERVDSFDAETIGSHDSFRNDSPFLRFAPDAQEMFAEWYLQFMQFQRGDDSTSKPSPLLSHFGKYPGLVGKVALIIHIADDGHGSLVSKRTLTKALAWIQYLTPHAERVYHATHSPETGAAELLLARIKRHVLPEKFKPWEITRNGWHGLTDREAVKKACRLLHEYGWLIELDPGGPGGVGRPADPVYAVSPVVGR